MNSFFIILLIGVLAVFGLYSLTALVTKNIRYLRLKHDGRTISWSVALSRIQAGEGIFVVYQKLLWLVEGKIFDKGIEIYTTTEQKGLLVQSRPKGKLLDVLNEYAPGRFKAIDNIPFTDPEINNGGH